MGMAYNGSWVNRFTLIIDLKPSVAQIVQRFSKARLNSLRRHEVIGVSTRTGGRQDLPALCEFERQLAQIQDFSRIRRFFSNNCCRCLAIMRCCM